MADEGIVQVLRWHDRQRRAWSCMFRVVVGEGGRRRYVGLTLDSYASSGQTLTPAVLRALADDLPGLMADDDAQRRALLRRYAPRVMPRPRPGPKRERSSEDVAKVWLAASDRGEPPGRAVESHFGVAPAVASRLVRRAREEGFLPPKAKGDQ
jgi:hypothetical protein